VVIPTPAYGRSGSRGDAFG